MSFLWRTRWLQPPTPLRDGVSDLHAYHLLSIHSQSHLFKPLRLSYVPGKKKSPQSSRWETNTYITMKLLQGKIKPTWDRRVWGGSGGGILDLLLREGDFPGGLVVKNLPANAGDLGLIPGLERFSGEDMATYSSILAGKSHGQRSLVGYSPWGRKKSDTTEQLNNDNLEKASKFRQLAFKVARSSHRNSLSGDEEARKRPQDGKGSEREPVKRSVAEALSKSVAWGLREFGRSGRSYRPRERSRFLLLASNCLEVALRQGEAGDPEGTLVSSTMLYSKCHSLHTLGSLDPVVTTLNPNKLGAFSDFLKTDLYSWFTMLLLSSVLQSDPVKHMCIYSFPDSFPL